jgi:hypothetical protein
MHIKDEIISTRAGNTLGYKPSIIAIAIVMAVAGFTAGCDSKDPTPVGKVAAPEQQVSKQQQLILQLEPKAIVPESGLAYSYSVPQLASEADGKEKETRSPYSLMEDGKPLGPPHAIHDDIRKNGKGAWSHWGQSIYFSSSDGTDPRQNNRKYALTR